MKKLYLFILTGMLVGKSSYAQFTTVSGVTATTDKVGIGTSTPVGKLTINNNNNNGLYIGGNTSSWQGPDLMINRNSTSPTVGYSPSIQFGEANPSYGALLQSYKGSFSFLHRVQAIG